MTEDRYKWQSEIYPKWASQNYVGLVQASTGAGKTIAMCKTIAMYQADFPLATILIVTPSSKLNKMWQDELDKYQIKNYKVMTYMTVVNKMQRDGLKCDCMICDECHHLASPVHGRVMELMPRAVLGCSATPELSVNILGKPMLNITVDEANLCDFLVHYTSFPMSRAESAEYDAITDRMRKRALSVSGGKATGLPPGRDTYGWGSYDAMVRKRRDISYKFESRIPYTVALVKKHLSSKVVIFTERRETVQKIKHALLNEEIMAVDDTRVSDYETGKANVLILCGKLREGWNSVSTNVVIISAVNTRVIKNVQTIGRALRVDPNNPDKKAHIYMLLAQGTSDESVIKNTASFYKGHYTITTIQQELGGRTL